MKRTKIYLIALVALMITSLGAMAQGGAAPYLNSTHTYTVNMEDGSNTAAWVITNDSGTPISPQPTFAATKSGNTATMVITWASSWAAVGNYKIKFSETGTCSSTRELPVSVIANTFYLSMNADGSECHDLQGQVLEPNATGNTTLLFTVNLNKDASWTINSWIFDFSVNVSTEFTLQSVKVNGGSNLGTGGIYAAQSIAGATATASIEVIINGPVETGAGVTVNVNNGKAIKGTISTPDNGTGDRTQVLTVNPLPATSTISAD